MAGDQRPRRLRLRYGGAGQHPPLSRISHGQSAPPVARTLLVAKIDVSVHTRNRHPIVRQRILGRHGQSAQGFVHLESFAMIPGIPTWRYAIGDALLEQQIFMAPGANTSYLRLELLRAARPCG